MKELDFEGIPDHIAADRAWEDYRQRNDSIIVDLFQVRDGEEKAQQLRLTAACFCDSCTSVDDQR